MDKEREMSNSEINNCIDIIQKILSEYSRLNNNGAPVLKKPEDPTFGYILGRNLRILRGELSDYIEERNKAVRQFGKYQAEEGSTKGSYIIDMKDKEQVEAYDEYMKSINSIKHNVKLCLVSAERLSGWNLPLAFESMQFQSLSG